MRKLLGAPDPPVTPDLRRIMFQQYTQNDVNGPILLHEGRFRVRAGDRCIEPSGSAHLRWLPSPGIAFDIETDVPCAGFDLDSLTVELPGFRTNKVVAHSMHLGSNLRIRAFAGTPAMWATSSRSLGVVPILEVRHRIGSGSQP